MMGITVRELTVSVPGAQLRVRATGPMDGAPVVFLHGWPEDSTAWDQVMRLASEDLACYAVDLPGIGGSRVAEPGGDKRLLAGMIHDAVVSLGLTGVTLVGHDVGGMIVFAYLRRFGGLAGAVIMDTVIAGVAPWEQVLANPWVWHFAFHTIPDLPERLVTHDTAAYFDYFYDAIATHPEAITPAARRRYVESYRQPGSLRQGFEFYRALWADAKVNAASASAVTTPVLYVRGADEGGDIQAYSSGLRHAGLRAVTTATIPDAGHFTPEEQPAVVARELGDFVGSLH